MPFSLGLTADAYEIQAKAGDILVVEAEANHYTPLLILAEGGILLPSGAIPEGRRSKLSFMAHRSGAFTVVITADPALKYDAPTGAYVISLNHGGAADSRPRWYRSSIEFGSADYIDTESFERLDGGRYRAWVLTKYAEKQYTRSSGAWDQSRLRYEIDCSARRSRVVDGYVYAGAEVRARTGSLDWLDWPPESKLEGMGRAICTIGSQVTR